MYHCLLWERGNLGSSCSARSMAKSVNSWVSLELIITHSLIGQGKILSKPIKFNVTISFSIFAVHIIMRALCIVLARHMHHVRNLQQNSNTHS